ncbi:unnamed protein product [Urochloa humidicola]
MLHGSCLSGEKGADAVRRRGATALQRRSAVVEEKEAVAAVVRQQEKALLKAQANRVASLVGAASSIMGVPYLSHGCYLSVQTLLHGSLADGAPDVGDGHSLSDDGASALLWAMAVLCLETAPEGY